MSLIQAVVLLAFWYTDSEDRTGAWHWTGTAISLCQTLGLHRDLGADTIKHHFTNDQLSLFRRIWWSCLIRDRWLSLAFGRPMKIQLEDCDVPMPGPEDVTTELKDVPGHVMDEYLPGRQDILAALWIKLVKLSKALGTMIQVLYRQQQVEPDLEIVKQCEYEMLQCALSDEEKAEIDPTTNFHVHHFQLFYE